MKILLFTHKNDIDGMRSIVLSKLAFKKIKYVVCKTFEITNKVKEFIDKKNIYDYDFIYITDLCIKEPLLTQINNDIKLKNKIKVIDHHKSEIEEGNDKYNYVNIKVQNEKGMCCGTSLFYQELLDNTYINKNDVIDEFVELTRLHDTWEWKNIYNNEKANELAILFELLGIEKYIETMTEKCKQSIFSFTKTEETMINVKKDIILKKVKEYTNNIVIKQINNLKVGISFIDYEYRNDLAQYLKDINYDIDFIMMIMLDKNNISYRSIKENVDVSKIATSFGGKRHEKAGASPIKEETKNKILKLLIK